MENYLPAAAFMFKMGRSVVMRHTFIKHPERKHQLISSRDIGRAGAKAFVQGPGWMDGVVRLAGDGLTVAEIDKVFKEVSSLWLVKITANFAECRSSANRCSLLSVLLQSS